MYREQRCDGEDEIRRGEWEEEEEEEEEGDEARRVFLIAPTRTRTFHTPTDSPQEFIFVCLHCLPTGVQPVMCSYLRVCPPCSFGAETRYVFFFGPLVAPLSHTLGLDKVILRLVPWACWRPFLVHYLARSWTTHIHIMPRHDPFRHFPTLCEEGGCSCSPCRNSAAIVP